MSFKINLVFVLLLVTRQSLSTEIVYGKKYHFCILSLFEVSCVKFIINAIDNNNLIQSKQVRWQIADLVEENVDLLVGAEMDQLYTKKQQIAIVKGTMKIAASFLYNHQAQVVTAN